MSIVVGGNYTEPRYNPAQRKVEGFVVFLGWQEHSKWPSHQEAEQTLREEMAKQGRTEKEIEPLEAITNERNDNAHRKRNRR